MDRPPLPEFSFVRSWSPRVKWVVGVLAVVYLIQLAVQPLFENLLTLNTLGHGFAPWQPLTYTFVQSAPAFALLGWFVILNFFDQTVAALGIRRFWLSTFVVWIGATFLTLAVGLTGLVGAETVAASPNWWIDAMIVWFAFGNRGSTINLMMVLPMKAENLAWLSGLLNLLGVAYYRDLSSVNLLMAWIVAWAVFWIRGDSLSRWRMKRKIEHAAPGLRVHEGGKSGERPRRGKPDEFMN